MGDLYGVVADRRRQLADVLDGLDDAQWRSGSLCGGWQARHVLAHLLMPLELRTVPFLVEMAKARFDFNRVNDRIARREARTPAELLAAFRAKADTRFHPPGFGPEAPLTDLFVHGRDICVPLGIELPVDPADAGIVGDLVTSARGQRGFGATGRLDGLALRATDLDRTWGAGAEVVGDAQWLILAATGRAAALDHLAGDGVDVLRSRLR